MRADLAFMVSAAMLLAPCIGGAETQTPATYSFTNGRWWNGSEYVSKQMYVADGVLRAREPPRIDQTIDLQGRYVIPPLADAHNHFLEPAKLDAYIACYLADGFYYVRDLANLPFVMDQIRDKLNQPTRLDFVTSMQGFTGPGGHPSDMIDYFVKAGVLPATWKPEYGPDAVFVTRTRQDVDRSFELLLREGAGHVKVFLAFSDEYDQNLTDPKTYGKHRGIDPKLVPHIVQRAHAAHLKVAAHVNTATDFRNALKAGVNGIEHVPGIFYDPRYTATDFRLTPADVTEARHRGITVTPTVNLMSWQAGEQAKRTRDEVVSPNLKLLKDAGVPILLGSDSMGNSPLTELFALRDLGIFSNQELLNIATRTTTAQVFPHRRLGRLEEGYAASFLVLDRNPLDDLDNVKSIALRMKQGHILALPPEALSRQGLACVGGAS